MGCPFRRSLVGGHPRLHDQGLCRAHDSGNRKLISRHPRRLSGASGLRLRLCGARQRQRTGPHCCLLDDRQRAWRHLLHLRGELSTALASARLGGECVAGCADPPSGLKCRMEARGWIGRRRSRLLVLRGYGDGPRCWSRSGPIRKVRGRRAPS